jgi:hypothetical protein
MSMTEGPLRTDCSRQRIVPKCRNRRPPRRVGQPCWLGFPAVSCRLDAMRMRPNWERVAVEKGQGPELPTDPRTLRRLQQLVEVGELR